MALYTITENDKADLDVFFTKEAYKNIGKDGYNTIVATDDEDYIAGAAQFYIGEDGLNGGIIAEITHLFVDKDFRENGFGSLLLSECRDVIEASDITKIIADIPQEDEKELTPLFENEGFVPEGKSGRMNLTIQKQMQ